MSTIVLAIVIAWLIITALPFLFWAVMWAITVIFFPSDPIVDPRKPTPPSRRPIFPSGRKGVLVFLGLYVAAAVAAYFVVSHH